MLRFLYSGLLALVAPFFLYSLFAKKTGKPAVGKRWREHFGQTPPIEINEGVSTKAVVWFHAVSVGEVIAVTPLIKRFVMMHPDKQVVITTTTPTGAEQAAKLAPDVIHRYMPLDFSFAVRGFLSSIKPSQLIIVETELWPNTLHQVAKWGVPITVINARLSERSCLRYQKVLPIFQWLASKIDHVLCQHQDDADRFLRLGMSKHKVAVTGSVKFDISIEASVTQNGQQLRHDLGAQRPVWIAASTHQGEDEQVLEAHRRLLQTHPTSLLLLVPRHPERFDDVATLCQKQGFSLIRRTEKSTAVSDKHTVYLADTMGEMMTLLAASDICFMGGSLLGDKVGGHNLLEPAALGIPSLTGPSYFNFSDITKQLIEHNACHVIADAEALSSILSEWLEQPELLNSMGDNARQVVARNKGAIERTLEQL
ncbi:lipid IV(A) 3-deoxy-D-manno-octulosonic acid transferase [Vibrio sp. 10N.286.48.B7]|uniref:lipid IV(A) 3-deoxy-D-manno-octulosonic acid transferase n=1 Tax=Vibrio sp. 10N.286.48.B7 TaxID=1880853 RepID=UPI000C848676|nr:lipid IV(A) 3-deoxy-D-manno-octulosonic acid transferase [Vibrio sp. 10N.286.48.B7]PMH78149.1 3-deoxy-D-manno-octulosonic acid transferase [Vibrio sp. 10N.286.48.B7]